MPIPNEPALPLSAVGVPPEQIVWLGVTTGACTGATSTCA